MSTYPPAVPKPATAGAPKTAVVNTGQAAYINIRQGPGTQYRDIGDIRSNTLIAYYPATRTSDAWIWIEQYGTVGWILSTLVTFQDISAPPPVPPNMATPYDGKVALWHWKGDSLAENTIEDVVKAIKTNAPYVTQLFVKTSDYTPQTGTQWMGYWDSKRSLAIDGPASIDNWVKVLSQNGIEFHAWVVARGGDPAGEANLIIQACTRPGVKSMILDVEPYSGFLLLNKDGVRPYMTRIRRALPGAFHIGMSVDPRATWYDHIYPQEWFPFVNSIHPQVYWATFRRTPDDSLGETFQVWGSYGRPIIPVLQGDAEINEMRVAETLATQKYQARGVSWWRIGVIGPVQWPGVNQPIVPGTPAPPAPTPPPPPSQYADEQIVKPDDAGYSSWTYTGQQELQNFQNIWGWKTYYKNTEAQTSKVAARWSPAFANSGKYEISIFVPGQNASTKNARFKIHGVRGASTELVVTIDQSLYRNQWVTLGVYDFDKTTVNAGTVFLNDLTGESDKQIAFDAVRWQSIVVVGSNPNMADGFNAPVGTAAERSSAQVWPGQWLDASPFAKLYFVGTPSEAYHTGADLNLPADADAHAAMYAAASGVVIFAGALPVWGNVIVVKHDPLVGSNRVVYTRSAHMESMIVKVGQRVTRGQQMGNIGNAFGRFAYHLHFDVSPTTILETQPEHWPGKNLAVLLANYINPRDFVMGNRPANP